MAARVVHLRDIRLHNNGGMVFPVCKVEDNGLVRAGSERFTTTGHYMEVTCSNCRRLGKQRYPWAYNTATVEDGR